MNDLDKIIAPDKKFVIVTHANPDGDAIGSTLALYHFLANQDLTVHAIIPDAPPHFLDWMPGISELLNFEQDQEKSALLLKEADVLFNLDFNVFNRADSLEQYLKNSQALKILIDHHPEPDAVFDHIFTDTSRSSTCEILYEILYRTNPEYMNGIMAQCLFTGIMTDTVCFRVNSSHPSTFKVVSELLSFQVDKDWIYDKVYDNFTPDRMRLLGHSLSHNMIVLPEYGTAYLQITRNEQTTYNLKKGDSEGFVNYPLSIKGVQFTVFFMEKEDHIKVSFRSKGRFDVGQFARKHFGGGGHMNAAGAESNLSLTETINQFLQLLPNYKDELT